MSRPDSGIRKLNVDEALSKQKEGTISSSVGFFSIFPIMLGLIRKLFSGGSLKGLDPTSQHIEEMTKHIYKAPSIEKGLKDER